MKRPSLGLLLALLVCPPVIGEEPPAVAKGSVRFTPPADQSNIPERYRLEARQFDYELELKYELKESGVDVFVLRYPSPVKSPYPENNTVYAEYYRPRKKGPFPAVIVLDITAGDQTLSRTIANYLAQNGIAGLFVQMAYYGPRRPATPKVRLLSTNVKQSMDAVRQTVLDLRFATAWLASRPEVNANRLGIMGTSLGSLVGTLTAEMEPRLGRLAILLGGGGFVDAFWDDPRARTYRDAYVLLGGTKESVKKIFAPVDPLTCAGNLKKQKVLIMAASRDDILPPRMATALWKASGEQQIVWFDCTHVGAVAYLGVGLQKILEHFH